MPVIQPLKGTPNAPATYSQPSRKGKKAWRKNVDVTEVEEGLEELNKEIIEGGVVAERPSDELFTLDTVGDASIPKRFPKHTSKPLKADEIIAARSAVPAVPLRKRPGDKTTDGIIPAKRLRTQYVTHKELNRLRRVADGHHESTIEVVDASYDPWAAEPQPEKEDVVHDTRNDKKKAPKTITHKPISLSANGKHVPAVQKPTGGYSYNPAFSDYEARYTEEANKAVEAEKKRLAEEEAERIKKEAAARSAAEAEAAEARAELSEWEEDSEWEGFQSGGEELKPTVKRPERKTPAQRNRAKRRKEEERRLKHEAKIRIKKAQAEQIKQIAKEVAEREAQRALLRAEQSDDSSTEGNDEMLRRRQLGKFKLPEKDLELVLPDELQDSLRRLKPEGNLLKDRYRTFFIYDATTYKESITFGDCEVSAAALDPPRGGPKNLPIIEALLDDDESEEARQNKEKPRLVILGGGWGSVALLKQLNPDDYHVTVISPKNYFLFTPMLPSATVGTLEMRSLVEPIRRILSRIDAQGKEVRFYVPYDKLVIAVGSVTNPHGVKGLENCFFLKDINDARMIRNQVIKNMELACLPTTKDEERKRLLSFVVSGGGPTGVEFAAELFDLLNEDLTKRFPRILRNEISVHLIQSRSHILNTYDETLSRYAEEKFARDQIEVLTNSRVKEVFPDKIAFTQKMDDGTIVTKEIPTGFCLWSTGVSQAALCKRIAAKLGRAQNNRHALETDTHLRVNGTPLGDVYAIGDCATVQNNVADNIVSFLRGLAFKHGKDPEKLELHFSDWRNVAADVKRRFPQAVSHLKRLDKLFAQFDKDQSGTLSFGELRELLKQIDSKLTSLPATAQRANQQGIYLAHKFNKLARCAPGLRVNDVRDGDVDGACYKAFEYHHLGSLAYIGNSAVFDLSHKGLNLTGGLWAVYAWRSVYFAQSVGVRTRVLMAMDWAKRGLFGREGEVMDINSLFDVRGKVVLVTGGARGIGRMISDGFVANGAKVYIASRDAAACEKAAAELSARGPGSAVAIPADLASKEECERLAAELARREKRLDVLVNNSGAAWGAPLDEFPDEQWSRVLTLNLHRVFTLTQLLLPLLEAAGAGRGSGGDGSNGSTGSGEISRPESSNVEGGGSRPAAVINIGSIDALRVPSVENYSYSAAKAGLHHLGRVLSQRLGPRGVAVNTLACGPFDTKMMAAPLRHFRDAIEDANPLGRIGRPADVAGACIFLASRAGSYINGATIAVDGGMHLAAKF
ncbi:hypothetical protein DL770_002577 [Monosporascus sp. CRB-9-2]|nr:hypothetical protein DL770_002577 [Monosporascus sp. CRB-9-2]